LCTFTESFSDAKEIPFDKVTKQLFLPHLFFLATKTLLLLQGKETCAKEKKTLCQEKKIGQEKKLLSPYQEEFSWHQKKICECNVELCS